MRSVRAKNEFFFYENSIERLHHKLGLHKILELTYLWLFTEQTVEQACFNIGLSPDTIVQWWQNCRTTGAKALEFEPKMLGTIGKPVQVVEAC